MKEVRRDVDTGKSRQEYSLWGTESKALAKLKKKNSADGLMGIQYIQDSTVGQYSSPVHTFNSFSSSSTTIATKLYLASFLLLSHLRIPPPTPSPPRLPIHDFSLCLPTV